MQEPAPVPVPAPQDAMPDSPDAIHALARLAALSARGGRSRAANRLGAATGRFARWHLAPTPVAEEEGWLLTYLDMVTLILVMMVVMLSFAGPGTRGLPEQSPSPVVAVGEHPEHASIVPPVAPPVTPPPAQPEEDPLAGLPLDRLDKNIEVIVNQGSVSFRISNEILFASGDARLSGTGLAVLGRLVPVLGSAARHRIVVEGHTDNVPIQTERFPSNWELSTGRAASVVRYLQGQGIDPARMRATGFADTRPLASNDTPQGRAQNRHVEVILEAPK
ncbi:OmpA/MotB family protein [Simplicispira lacusdiani]|uniref:OmpA/MotB family protein n=1 Tax=Simplicispira lacusdiani TaxID=2213010 RepID=UPI0018E5A5F5|nr:OmpA family protein [Simplicispira lacusdiani]